VGSETRRTRQGHLAQSRRGFLILFILLWLPILLNMLLNPADIVWVFVPLLVLFSILVCGGGFLASRYLILSADDSDYPDDPTSAGAKEESSRPVN
jgi:hypothetical protein